VHAEPFIGLQQLLFPKLFATIFGLGQWHSNTPKKKIFLPTSPKRIKPETQSSSHKRAGINST
jgi:hypothetical protein